MKPITPKLLQLFLKKASENLEGEWVVIGGTVLPLLGIDHRITTDIDFVSCSRQNNEGSLRLMEIAATMGMPVEAINQAGAFFLHKIPKFHEHLIVLKKAENCIVYRPDFELYLKLKIVRLTESDFEDIIHYFKYSKKMGEEFSVPSINSVIKAALAKNSSDAKRLRLEKLLEILTS